MKKLVSFQGVAGAYSEQAAIKFFGANIKTLACDDFNKVFLDVIKKRARFGVLPIENTLAGSIHQNYDLLLKHKVWISGELKLRVSHNLIAQHGSKVKDLKTIYSHPQALSQCSEYIRKHRKAKPIPYFDTAGSVKYVAQAGDNSIGAIGSAQAAKKYKMKILESEIENDHQNFTRFVIIEGKKPRSLKKINTPKTSIAFALQNVPGGLHKAISVFAIREIDLLKIESRPIPGSPWKYLFYLDFGGNVSSDKCRRALYHLEEVTKFIKILGCYSTDITAYKN